MSTEHDTTIVEDDYDQDPTEQTTTTEASPEKDTRRAKRRFADSVAIARQVQIARAHGLDAKALTRDEKGRFRKQHALDCGTPNCKLCGNVRKNTTVSSLNRLTRQERVAVLAMPHELAEAFAPASEDTGPDAA